MKKKLRKFSDGGFSTIDKSNPVPSIDDDVRSRAMKFVENASEESRDLGAPVTRAASKSTSKVSQTVAPPTKPKVDMEAEKARTEKMLKNQALETVSPELDLLPIGKAAAGAGALYAGARAIGKRMLANRAEKEVAEKAAKNVARKAEEGFSPAEALDALKPKTAPKAAKTKARPKTKAETEKMRNEAYEDVGSSGLFKRGGKVSSASRRADGCAIRGKTRI
jgi:hypothetical protein